MLKTVLWVAAACVAVLVALAVSRSLNLGDAPAARPAAVAIEPAEAPVAEPPSAPVVEEAKPAPTPDELQIQEDAAATGMTTVEPEETPPTN